MNFVNRQGHIHDSMFKELEEFAQHVKCYCCGQDMFQHTATIQVNGVDKFKVEDIRIIFTEPKHVQLKCRISEMLAAAGLMEFNKTDTVKVIIKTKGPSKEPNTVVTVTEWFDELQGLVPGIEKNPQIKVMPNKWLYLAGTEA